MATGKSPAGVFESLGPVGGLRGLLAPGYLPSFRCHLRRLQNHSGRQTVFSVDVASCANPVGGAVVTDPLRAECPSRAIIAAVDGRRPNCFLKDFCTGNTSAGNYYG